MFDNFCPESCRECSEEKYQFCKSCGLRLQIASNTSQVGIPANSDFLPEPVTAAFDFQHFVLNLQV